MFKFLKKLFKENKVVKNKKLNNSSVGNVVSEMKNPNNIKKSDILGKKVNQKNGFYTKVVGVTFEGRQRLVPKCRSGAKLKLIREKNNRYDKNAIAVYNGNDKIGYIKSEIASRLAIEIDNGKVWNAYVSEVTGGYAGKNYGVNILLK